MISKKVKWLTLGILTLTFLCCQMTIWQPMMNSSRLAAATGTGGYSCQLDENGNLVQNGTACETPECECVYENEEPMQMIFTVLYVLPVSISTIIFGYAADSRFRLFWLAASIAVLATSQFLFPAAESFAELAAIRVLGCLAEGATQPVSMVVINFLFVKNTSKAMGIFNWAMYLAYAFTIALASVTKSSFYWSYYIIGICCGVSAVSLLIVARFIPKMENDNNEDDEEEAKLKEAETVETQPEELSSWKENTLKILRVVAKPATILILIGGLFRHTAGFTLGINQVDYFSNYKGFANAEMYLFWCPILAGVAGAFIGGFLTDWIKKNKSFSGAKGALFILFISQFLGAPLMAIVLSIDPPYCFVLLYIAYFFLEMWFGIFLVAFSSLFDSSIQGKAIGYTLFIMRVVCGNLPSLIVHFKVNLSYHYAMLIMIPGFQFISAIFFLAAFFSVKVESSA